MSLAKTLNKGKQKTKIHIDNIRVNRKNDYEINEDEVRALALSIKKHGQLHNAVVYEEDGDDGKHYTLLSGEKRYRAITLLYTNNEHDGKMDVLVQEKPENQYEMRDVINDANLQRKPDHATLYKEIKAKDEYYQYLVNKGERPGLHRRDYIANALGISSRNVDNIINEFEGNKKRTKAITSSGRKEYNKQFEKNLAKKHGFLTSVSQKSITFKFTGTEELNEFLSNCIGIEEQYNYEGDTDKK